MDQTRILPAVEAEQDPLETIQVLEFEADDDASGDWITRLLRSGLFRHLTPEQSHRFFVELEPVSVCAGEVVVEQGAPGEHFYVVTQGRCAVTRQVPSSNRELQLNVLREGDAFGEAALISGTPRMTTVRMLSDGALMRLERSRFEKLVAAPMLSAVSYDEARRLVDEGAVWLDVRLNDQRSEHVFDGSLTVPGHVLSIEAQRLDSTKTYVVYCESGAYSATGAFLLTRLGFEAHVLDGGLTRMRTDASVAAESRASRVEPPEPHAVGEQESRGGAGGARHGVMAQEGSTGADEAAELRAALASLAEEKDGAIAVAAQAEERARVLGRHNAALMRLNRVQRDKHQAVERQLEDARGDLERRVETERDSSLRKLRKVRRKLRDAHRDRAQVVARLEEECGAKASALRDVEARLQRVLETARSTEIERSRLEQLLKQADARLMDASGQLTETKIRLSESDLKLSSASEKLDEFTEQLTETKATLSESDANLSKTIEMLADANERLTTTTRKLAETNEKLSSTQARLALVEHQLTANGTQLSGTEAKPSSADSRLAKVDGELAATQAKLANAHSEEVEARAARQRAESALEIALGELRSQIEGLATLRCALPGAVAED